MKIKPMTLCLIIIALLLSYYRWDIEDFFNKIFNIEYDKLQSCERLVEKFENRELFLPTSSGKREFYDRYMRCKDFLAKHTNQTGETRQ